MLKRSKRIQGRRYVAYLMDEGEQIKSRHFVVRALPNTLNRHRYGIVLSKKVEKSAVRRNRKRRQIYDALAAVEAETGNTVPKGLGFDIILLVRRSAMDLSYQQLYEKIQSLTLYSRLSGDFSDTPDHSG